MAHYLAPRLKSRLVVAGGVILALLLGGCGKPARTNNVDVVPMQPHDVSAIATELRSLTDTANRDTMANTDKLVAAVNQFLRTPNSQSRGALQQAWLNAHKAFAATRALLIADHDDLLFKIDAWPIQPGFLDSLPNYPDSGIINDFTLQITRETLIQQNGITDREEVSLGFHPLEYYAFARPASDFVAGDNQSPDARIIDRRRHALSLIAALLDLSVKQLAGRMNGDLAASIPRSYEDMASDNRLIRQIITGSLRLTREQFREASLIVTDDTGHDRYSQSSIGPLAEETRILRQLYASSGVLMKILRHLDGKIANNLDTTLTQLTAALASDSLSTINRARLPLMYSALEQQFSDLRGHLPGPH